MFDSPFESFLEIFQSIYDMAFPQQLSLNNIQNLSQIEQTWIDSFKTGNHSLICKLIPQQVSMKPSELTDYQQLYSNLLKSMPSLLQQFFGHILTVQKPSLLTQITLQETNQHLIYVLYYNNKLQLLKPNFNAVSLRDAFIYNNKKINAEQAQDAINGLSLDKYGQQVLNFYISTSQLLLIDQSKIELSNAILSHQLDFEDDNAIVYKLQGQLTQNDIDNIYLQKLKDRLDANDYIKVGSYEYKKWWFYSIILLFVVLFAEFIAAWIGVGQIVNVKNRIKKLE